MTHLREVKLDVPERGAEGMFWAAQMKKSEISVEAIEQSEWEHPRVRDSQKDVHSVGLTQRNREWAL